MTATLQWESVEGLGEESKNTSINQLFKALYSSCLKAMVGKEKRESKYYKKEKRKQRKR